MKFTIDLGTESETIEVESVQDAIDYGRKALIASNHTQVEIRGNGEVITITKPQ